MPKTSQQEYDRWLAALTVESLVRLFREFGCRTVLAKQLSNDNSKNQIYLSSELSQVALIPSGDVTRFAGSSTKATAGGPIYQAPVRLSWIGPTGPHPAPDTKLIYYPQYPEVRLSGFLKGCADAPRSLLTRELRGTEAGRLLLLGIGDGSQVFGVVLPPEAGAREGVLSQATETYGVFTLWQLDGTLSKDPRRELLRALSVIHDGGWHNGQKLGPRGPLPYMARNAGGYTLESLLGIRPNGVPEPDFAGWEVKSHGVGTDFLRPRYGPVTLMTPEPDGGYYSTDGVVEFMLRYGYPSARHEGRRDYAGTQRHGDELHPRCGTRLQVEGYDAVVGALVDDGRIALRDADDRLAASWSFSKLLSHWKSKHAQTVYVPTITALAPDGGYMYRYGSKVVLGEGTTFPRLLSALVARTVYYDPGTNIVKTGPSGEWKRHSRNQFRTKWADVQDLYDKTETVDVDGPN